MAPVFKPVELDFIFQQDWPSVTHNNTDELPPQPLVQEHLEMPSAHFLALARTPWANDAPRIDTSTVAAADFDVDAATGFMPPHTPVVSLPIELSPWETVLEKAQGLTLGSRAVTDAQREKAAGWRGVVDSMPVLNTRTIANSEVLLRRAHHVLTFILHFYIHSQSDHDFKSSEPQSPVIIPQSLSIPLVQLSKDLLLPPILTYSDNVLYNWTLIDPTRPISQNNIQMISTFTQSESEKHFYLTSAKIELRGVEALDLMRSCMDEVFIGDEISLKRISEYLRRLSVVIDDMAMLLMTVRDGCDPQVFYNDIRPWFNGWGPGSREWLFEGVSEEDQQKFSKLSGPSAGQSSLIHALDVFLGVDHTHTHSNQPASSNKKGDPTFLMKMEQYMPRHHRSFLQHLRSANQTHLRALILSTLAESNNDLREAYDEAVMSLKKFRDGHIRIATLYIVSQARKEKVQQEKVKLGEEEEVRGTGGTSLVPFLKEIRDNTLRTSIGST